MNSLLRTTVLSAAVLTAGIAHAEMTKDSSLFTPVAEQTDLHASDFIGMRVYAAEPQEGVVWSMDASEGAQIEWDDVGEIHDMVITRDGDISAVLVDISGFLGIGERQVAMNMNEIRFVSDSETAEGTDFFLVIPASKADLEEAPAYARAESVETDQSATGAEHMTENPFVAGDPLNAEKVAALTTEDLTGARVYDASGEWIGEVSQLNLNDDGQIEAAIVDVGGFLGLGEKPVKLSIGTLDISRGDDGETYNLSIPMSETQLERLPTWEG